MFGGASAAGDIAAIQVVDPTAGTARVLGRLSQTLSHATAVVCGGRVFVAGGRHAGRAVDAILEFHPETRLTTVAGRLPRAMSDATGAVDGRTAYLVGGESSLPLDTIVILAAG